MIIIRWIIAVPLIAVAASMLMFNGWILVRVLMLNKEAPSVVPIIGGVMGSIGLFVLPSDLGWVICLLPLVLDWGGLPSLAIAAWQGAFR